MYGAVTNAAAAVTLPGISRHTKLLETGAIQTKQRTALPISRHKIKTPSNAISLGSCSAGLGFACPEAFAAEWVRHSGAPLASPARRVRPSCPVYPAWPEPRRKFASAEWVTRHHFLIDIPKRLETPLTRTKQITERISNRDKIGPLPNANHRFLIDPSKRLETPLTQTKQTSEVISNRNKIGGLTDAIRRAKRSKACRANGITSVRRRAM